MSLQYNSIPKGYRQKHKVMFPDWQVYTRRNVWKCAFYLPKMWNIAMPQKEWRQPNIGKMSNDARKITLNSNPSRGTVLPAPHGKGDKCEYRRFRKANWVSQDYPLKEHLFLINIRSKRQLRAIEPLPTFVETDVCIFRHKRSFEHFTVK